jgi:hypothetical protein
MKPAITVSKNGLASEFVRIPSFGATQKCVIIESSGFGFEVEFIERIAANRTYFGEFDPFGDFDLLFGASKLNLKILDVPIRYKERVYGETNIHR